MSDALGRFERIVRRAQFHTEEEQPPLGHIHPFDERGIYPAMPPVVRSLFDDGHYSQATFEACKYLEAVVRTRSGLSETGFKLMMQALSPDSPLIRLTPLTTTSEKDEQKGYQFILAGSELAIRNPRGHDADLTDLPDRCLEHLSLLSLLLRRLDEAVC